MSPVTHFFIGWSVANTFGVNRRERLLVTLAGIIPDIDGAGLILDLFSRASGPPLQWWSKFHHVLGHNIGLGLLILLICLRLSTRRLITGGLVIVSFHLHLLCDLVGSKGPDGYQWPIPYWLPFTDKWQWIWAGQWPLDAWPNFAVTAVAVTLTFYLAWKRGLSPLEFISAKANNAFVASLRARFGRPTGQVCA